jgi:hypothetical protein
MDGAWRVGGAWIERAWMTAGRGKRALRRPPVAVSCAIRMAAAAAALSRAKKVERAELERMEAEEATTSARSK